MTSFIKKYRFLIIFIVLFFVIRLFELNQVGETWDEIAKVRNGQLHLKAIANLDFSYDTWVTHKEHPPLGKIFLALPTYLTTKFGITLLNDNVYELSKQYNLARVVSLLFASGTLFLTFFIAKKWFSITTAWISVIGLSMFPHFVAHSFIATLESPQTFFITLLFFMLVYLEHSDKIRDLLLIAGVVALGLLVKLSSIFFLPLPFLFTLTHTVILRLPPKNLLKNIFKKNLIIYSVALILFILFWPWLWANPVLRFIETLGHFNVVRTEYFIGRLIHPPIYYYFYYFAITVPVIYLVGFLLGIKNIFSRKYFLILIWFLLPFLASFSGFKQNGIRYLYSAFPAFCILSAVGFDQFLQRFKSKYLILAILFLSLLINNISSSPYYLDYYNIFVKNTNNVYTHQLAQVGWWGEGIKQTVIYLNSIAQPNDSLCIKLTPTHVLPKLNNNFEVYLDKTDNVTCRSKYLITNTLDIWSKGYVVDQNIYENIYEEKAFGAPIVQVYKLK